MCVFLRAQPVNGFGLPVTAYFLRALLVGGDPNDPVDADWLLGQVCMFNVF